MKSIYVSQNYLESLEKIGDDILHSESTLYLDKYEQKLYKILNYKLRKERERIVEFLNKYYNYYCSLPNEKVFSANFSEFCGYTQSYFESFINLSKIFDEKIPISIRRNLAHSTSKTFEDFKDEGIIYSDIHPENIIVNSQDFEDFRIIDMDSIELESDITDKYEYQNSILLTHRLISQTAFSIILGIDLQELIADYKHMNKRLVRAFEPICKSKAMTSIVESTFLMPDTLLQPSEYIRDIKSQDIQKVKNNILQLKL